MHFLQSLLIAINSPRVWWTFVADKTQDLKERASIIFDERTWEVSDWNCEKIRVKVSINVVDGVRKYGWRNGSDAQIRKNWFISHIWF